MDRKPFFFASACLTRVYVRVDKADNFRSKSFQDTVSVCYNNQLSYVPSVIITISQRISKNFYREKVTKDRCITTSFGQRLKVSATSTQQILLECSVLEEKRWMLWAFSQSRNMSPSIGVSENVSIIVKSVFTV